MSALRCGAGSARYAVALSNGRTLAKASGSCRHAAASASERAASGIAGADGCVCAADLENGPTATRTTVRTTFRAERWRAEDFGAGGLTILLHAISRRDF